MKQIPIKVKRTKEVKEFEKVLRKASKLTKKEIADKIKEFTKLAKQTDEYKEYCKACGRSHTP